MPEENTNYTPPVKKTIPPFVGIAVIIIVAVVLFGGVFAWQYFTVKPQVVVQSQNQTAGWKTYTSTQYGFEFKYPANLYATTASYSPKSIGVCDTATEPTSLDQSCYFGVDYYENLQDLVGNQAGESGSPITTALEYINARGWTGVTEENLLGASGYCGTILLPNEQTTRSCIFEYNGHIFDISKPDAGVGKQIFPTFKFTNNVGQSPITVIYPNGGETLARGALANIKWQDSTPVCTREDCTVNSYDVKLIPVSPSDVASYTIAFNITGQGCNDAKCFPAWVVGRAGAEKGEGGAIVDIPNGKYFTQVCIRKGMVTGACDEGDNYFTITK